MKMPTLVSHASVSGSVVASSALGVLVHSSSVGHNINESGGGGGASTLTCPTPKSGLFAAFMSPVYSDVEDATVGGNIAISGLVSCWLGLARDKVSGNVTINHNQMGDPDAIEIIANRIGKNLSCSGNRHPSAGPPGAEPVWDNAEAVPMGPYFPRTPPITNTVRGKRVGQCKLSSPTTKGAKPGPGLF
jgi:hypothetical protein